MVTARKVLGLVKYREYIIVYRSLFRTLASVPAAGLA